MSIFVDYTKCTTCGICGRVCPFGAVAKREDGRPVIGDTCTLCGACENACPTKAIVIDRQDAQVDLSCYRDVWVFVEQRDGEIKRVSLEMLGEGKRLADKLGQKLTAVIVGCEVSHLGPLVGQYGADTAYILQSKHLASYTTDGYSNAITGLITTRRPSVFLFGATSTGRDLAPRVATRVGTGITADCTELDVDRNGQLVQTRPAFGGNIMASILCPNTRPQIATVRPGVMKALSPDPSRACRIESWDIKIDPRMVRTKIIETVKLASAFRDLTEANTIVAGGIGVGNADNWILIERLAKALGASIGATRKVVDAGWQPHELQIGQTGKTVSPQLYVACGISGAIQHEIGIREAAKVIAINNDPNAPIFKIADLGIVGDLCEIVPALVQALEER